MSETRKNLYLGLFIVVAIATFAWLILFINPSTGDGKNILHVRFSDISGITTKTRVCYAGNPVGSVIAIKKLQNETKSDELGRLFVYELTLKIDSAVEVFDTDQISLNTSGLMGERTVGISPKACPLGITPQRLSSQETIYAKSSGQLEHLMGQVANLSQKMERFVVDFQSWFSENSPKLSHVVSSCSTNMQLMQEALEDIKKQNMVAKTGKILDQVERSTTSLVQITKQLETGKGTIGKLIQGEDLYLHFNGILSKANTLMNDINHYGLLFQYDKHWQRGRTKRANILATLQSPEEFRSYFETEIGSVHTSIARLSSLVEKMDKEKIPENPHFQKEFMELMRQVDSLSNTLKLYNEGLLDKPSLRK